MYIRLHVSLFIECARLLPFAILCVCMHMCVHTCTCTVYMYVIIHSTYVHVHVIIIRTCTCNYYTFMYMYVQAPSQSSRLPGLDGVRPLSCPGHRTHTGYLHMDRRYWAGVTIQCWLLPLCVYVTSFVMFLFITCSMMYSL